MVVTAQDIDLKCVHMTYLQLSLYGIPAVVIHGNTLTVEEWSRWYTPVYMLDGWAWKSQCSMTDAKNADDETIKQVTEPLYAAIKSIDKLISEEPIIIDEIPNYKEEKSGQLCLF